MNSYFTLITAHSGFDSFLPNTLESVVAGMESGSDFVEVDVRSTKDGIAVLFHDDFMMTREYGAVKISDITLSELNLLIKSDSILKNRIPEIIKLEDVISVVKDFRGFLNMDVKDDSCIVPMIKVIRDADMVNSIIISGCEYSRASTIKNNYPEIQVLLNLNEKQLFNREKPAYIVADEICNMAVKAACCGINIEFTYLSDELIQRARMRYLPISIWTLTDSDNLDYYLNMGLYSITTTAVNLLVEKRKRLTEKMAFSGIFPEKI